MAAMAKQYSFLVTLFLFYSFSNIRLSIATSNASSYHSRSSFPKGFVFGASSAAYQVIRSRVRAHCIIDVAPCNPCNIPRAIKSESDFCTSKPTVYLANSGCLRVQILPSHKKYKQQTSIVFCASPPPHAIQPKYCMKVQCLKEGEGQVYGTPLSTNFRGDVQLMKFVGLDAFRMSISWSRILPRGKLSGGINKEGIAFYNNLINELLSNGIQPFVTIFHWDLPQALEDEYSGFLSPLIVDDYQDFAELCFKEFGDRIKHWITLNEPYIFTNTGYDVGTFPPGRCSAWLANNCTAGNSATEPYVVAHHQLLCHAAAVKLYNQKYKATQKGEIGITLVSHWMVPYSSKKQDSEAAQRALDFMYGWFMHPLVYGEYPKIMRSLVGKRLPAFTAEQVMMLKGSFDFLGLNYYTANYAAHTVRNSINVSSSTDSLALLTTEKNGKPIGDPTGASFFFVYPQGLEDLLVYIKEKYQDPIIYITENGLATASTSPMKESIKDLQRVNFFYRHLSAVQNAIKRGVKVKGFFVWSFLDTFEWNSGYTLRFGLYYVDYQNGLKRYPKQSALWFRKWLLKE